MAASATIKDFTDLEAWKLARELRRIVYEMTKRFPADERHVLVAPMRRAAISITANLAEGYGRYSYQENPHFCRLARGSAYELRDHLTTALDARHPSNEDWKKANQLALRVIQLLNGYIRSTRACQQAAKEK
jgi:four helix bundle protein